MEETLEQKIKNLNDELIIKGKLKEKHVGVVINSIKENNFFKDQIKVSATSDDTKKLPVIFSISIPEKPAMEKEFDIQYVLKLIVQRIALDLKELIINGNTSIEDDPFLATVDGLMAKADFDDFIGGYRSIANPVKLVSYNELFNIKDNEQVSAETLICAGWYGSVVMPDNLVIRFSYGKVELKVDREIPLEVYLNKKDINDRHIEFRGTFFIDLSIAGKVYVDHLPNYIKSKGLH